MYILEPQSDGTFDTKGALDWVSNATPNQITSGYFGKPPLLEALDLLAYHSVDPYLGHSLTTEKLEPLGNCNKPINIQAVPHAEAVVRAMVAKLTDQQLAPYKGDDFIKKLLAERETSRRFVGAMPHSIVSQQASVETQR